MRISIKSTRLGLSQIIKAKEQVETSNSPLHSVFNRPIFAACLRFPSSGSISMEKGIIFPFFLHCVFFLLHLFFLLYIHGRNILERFMGWKGPAPAPPTPRPDPPLPKLDSDEDFHITGPRHMMTASPTETIEIDWYGCTSCFRALFKLDRECISPSPMLFSSNKQKQTIFLVFQK